MAYRSVLLTCICQQRCELRPHLPVELRIMEARLQDSRRLAQGFILTVAGSRLEG